MNEKLAQTINVFEDDKKRLAEQIESTLNFKANQRKCLEDSADMPQYFQEKIIEVLEALDAQLHMITNLYLTSVKCLDEIKKKHRSGVSEQIYH